MDIVEGLGAAVLRGITYGLIGFVCGTALYKLKCYIELLFKYKYLKKKGFARNMDYGEVINGKFYGNFINGSIEIQETDIRRLNYSLLKKYIEWRVSEGE